MAITQTVVRNGEHPYNKKLLTGWDTVSAGGDTKDELTSWVLKATTMDMSWHVFEFNELDVTLYKPHGLKGKPWKEELANRKPAKNYGSDMPGPDMSHIELKPQTDDRKITVEKIYVVAIEVPGTGGWSRVAGMFDHGTINGKSFPKELYKPNNFYTREEAEIVAAKLRDYRAEEQKSKETKTKKKK